MVRGFRQRITCKIESFGAGFSQSTSNVIFRQRLSAVRVFAQRKQVCIGGFSTLEHLKLDLAATNSPIPLAASLLPLEKISVAWTGLDLLGLNQLEK